VIALTDLMEAEGRLLRRSTIRTVIAAGCIGVTVLLALVGAGFFLWAGYRYLLPLTGPVTARLICGLVVLCLAGLMAWLTRRLTR